METLLIKAKQFHKGDLLKKHPCHHKMGQHTKPHTAQKLEMFKTSQK